MKERRRLPEPFTLVIFGATGDLTHRKLIPAVFALFRQGLLPEGFRVVGFARRDKTDEDFRDDLRQSMVSHSSSAAFDETSWVEFSSRLFYHRSTFEDLSGYRSLAERIADDASAGGTAGNCLFYMAAQPDDFRTIVSCLQQSGLARKGCEEGPWSRIIVEKPFGADLESARSLNAEVSESFCEDQVFRIDHYLGKETVQNILVFRFANSIFEPIWNHKHVDHVQITVAETLGAGRRGRFYDGAGALRDMVQSHMMHLLCLVAMEPPNSTQASDVRDEKVKLLEALRRIPQECVPESVVRGQYAAGELGGETVPGYRDEEGVAADSMTETFVAFRTYVDNWRWAGVPFYLRTGKRMAARITEISVHFKPVPSILFNADREAELKPNVLALRIQPNEGISLQFQVKAPGAAMRIRPLKMDFDYTDAFGGAPADAYERLLLDAAFGDQTLFTRSDEVEAAWAFVTPLIEGCRAQPCTELPTYAAGSWGPREADGLLERDGRHWHLTRRTAHPPAGQDGTHIVPG